jgi:hypothetical protein
MADEDNFNCFYYDSDDYIRGDYDGYVEFDDDSDEDESEDDGSMRSPSRSITNHVIDKPFAHVPTPWLHHHGRGAPAAHCRARIVAADRPVPR